MTDPIQSRGTDLQRRLSDFLYGELLHTMGSYQLACDKLEELREELGGSAAEKRLDTVAEAAYRCNDRLRNGLHRPAHGGVDDPELGRRPSPFKRRPQLPRKRLLKEISTFYVDAEAALTLHIADQRIATGSNPPPGNRLGSKLAFIHDPQRRGRDLVRQPPALIQGKIDRTRARLEALREFDPEGRRSRRAVPGAPVSAARDEGFQRILEGHAGGRRSLLLTIVDAMSEAHMWMHEAEHVLAQSFGPRFTRIPKTSWEVQRMLRYAVALNTFVFVAARAVPWIFAEDETERDHVLDEYEDCCNRLAPTYCMWISAEFSLLALHRRAFAWWTMGKQDRAYRDFHKLTRLLRGLRQPAEKRGLRVPGTKTFIEGMTGMSELHIGRIYRGQHAHRMALRYFERASRHLKGWEAHEEVGEVIKNSSWRISLLLNEGKANYELGHVKRSILYYARAWRAFLLLVESETHATANVDIVMRFIKWLAPIVDEPELSKRELRERIAPLVEQFVALRSPIHLRLLAADIVTRMGHLLFILRLPPGEGRPSAGGRPAVPAHEHDLAFECISQASSLDPTSTLAAADLLRIEQEVPDCPRPPRSVQVIPLAEHWPSGSGHFEEAARITEYTLQKSLVPAVSTEGESATAKRAKVAQELLGAFLAHTDSSNVKLAQVYGYLMREKRAQRRKTDPGEHTLDLVCLRRYASFFPFLPRPSAFRAPGGGYFVQARESGTDEEPFGIAIDPGPDFIENLYRCGYGLADIQMMVLTHDHADHIASVDALLALMGYRMGLGDDTFDREKGRCLAIVGNESVYRRYEFFNDPDRDDAVRVMSFEDIAEITAPGGRAKAGEIGILLEPKSLRIEQVRSWGHTDANGRIAQAFLLSFGPDGDRRSILFTGDTGTPPGDGPEAVEDEAAKLLFAPGTKSLWEAVGEADVVVAHLSSVPLRELRELTGLGEGVVGDKTIAEYKRIWSRAAAQANDKSADQDAQRGIKSTEFLLNQIQFGFRSGPNKKRNGGKAGKDFRVSPFTDISKIKKQSEQHLYLTGLIELAERMKESGGSPLLLVGELREELGTFRTQVANRIDRTFFRGDSPRPSALTADIGLRVRLSRSAHQDSRRISVLCTTCDLDNDLMPGERFHEPGAISEVCVKGEDEGVFYNCRFHDPLDREDKLWVESVERYDVFGE